MINPDCHDSMFFVRPAISQHGNFHSIFREPRGEQCRVFDECIIFAVTRSVVKRFERITPMILNASFFRVARGTDREVNRSVDHADARALVSASTFQA